MFKDEFLKLFEANGYNFCTQKQIMQKMNSTGFERKVVADALQQLCDQGELVFQKGKYALPSKVGARRGKISLKQGGYGFLVCDDGKPDWFVPPSKLFGAMNGDIVLAQKHSSGGDQSDECTVLCIIERAVKQVVGTFDAIKSGGGFVVADDSRIGYDIFVSANSTKGAKNGQKVVALITKYPQDNKNPQGTITEILGNPFDKGTDILSIIRAFGLYEEFPQDVANAAKKIPQQVLPSELENRRDFRQDIVITIDGEDAKDLDDAVSVQRTQEGYRLFVHIADVAHYVSQKSAIDKEAFNRGTSVYFPDRVLPMLPRELSNGICSLNSGTDKLTLSAILDFDAKGKPTSCQLTEGVIKTRHRMTYDVVTAILEGDQQQIQKYNDIYPMLVEMEKLANLLTKRRQERGALDFELPESKILLDQNGYVFDIKAQPRTISHRIIEEFMLSANEAVAEQFLHLEVPFVFRIHEAPSDEKMKIFEEFISPFGLSLKNKKGAAVQPKTLQALLDAIKDREYKAVVSKMALRSMQKAKYSPNCLGHFGLAAKYYCHFTSPIRRYPDLAIHRIIKYVLKKGTTAVQRFETFAQEAAQRSSARERAAEEAEREVDNLKKAEFMAGRIGEVYSGTISGVVDFGFFVELDNTVEGLVKIESLPSGFSFDQKSMSMKSKNKSYRLGDRLDIKVARADLALRKVEFVLP